MTLNVRPGDDPIDIKIRLLLLDSEFSSRFVKAWLELYGWKLCPAEKGNHQTPDDPQGDSEPEYVPFTD